MSDCQELDKAFEENYHGYAWGELMKLRTVLLLD